MATSVRPAASKDFPDGRAVQSYLMALRAASSGKRSPSGGHLYWAGIARVYLDVRGTHIDIYRTCPCSG